MRLSVVLLMCVFAGKSLLRAERAGIRLQGETVMKHESNVYSYFQVQFPKQRAIIKDKYSTKDPSLNSWINFQKQTHLTMSTSSRVFVRNTIKAIKGSHRCFTECLHREINVTGSFFLFASVAEGGTGGEERAAVLDFSSSPEIRYPFLSQSFYSRISL